MVFNDNYFSPSTTIIIPSLNDAESTVLSAVLAIFYDGLSADPQGRVLQVSRLEGSVRRV
jgi:hypothetical protein